MRLSRDDNAPAVVSGARVWILTSDHEHQPPIAEAFSSAWRAYLALRRWICGPVARLDREDRGGLHRMGFASRATFRCGQCYRSHAIEYELQLEWVDLV